MPDPAGKSPPGSGVDRKNMKKCPRCLEDKPVSEFNKDASKKDGFTSYCRPCSNRATKEHYEKNKERYNKNSKAWKKNNPDKVKEWIENNSDYWKEWEKKNPDKAKERTARQYGMTREDYNNLLAQQNNRCAICREESKDGKALSVDHDHSCCPGKKSCGKCVRQLLCSGCNWMLGNAKDNPEILKAAQKYLERHSRPKNLAKNLD